MDKTWFIDIELILDINSLFLSIIKNQDPSIDTKQFQTNPQQFLEDDLLFFKYVSTLKPQIGAIETITFLRQKGINVESFSHLETKYTEAIKKSQNIIDIKPVQIDNSVILTSRQMNVPNSYLIKNHSFKSDYWKEIDAIQGFEQFPWNLFFDGFPDFQQPQYKVSSLPNDAVKFWTSMKIPSISISSKVIHGFNRGGSLLGIPTANLQINNKITAVIKDLIPGVYAGTAILNQVQYGTVLSIGYNPYFSNQNKTIEANLFSDFDHDFYDSPMDLTIMYFIRPESDFKCFGILYLLIDHLIKFINNDKFIAQQLQN